MARLLTESANNYRSVNATARDFHGFTEQMSYARLVLSTSAREPMPKIDNTPLPQRYAAMSLVDYYRENFLVLYPFLSDTSLLSSLDMVYNNDVRSTPPMDHWVVRMVLAVSLASQSRRQADAQYQEAIGHVVEAMKFVETVIQPGSLAGIQTMLLLVLYSLLDPYHFKSWYLIGLASRAMIDIGIHQDPPRELRLSDAQLQMMKRVYTSVYILDRSVLVLI